MRTSMSSNSSRNTRRRVRSLTCRNCIAPQRTWSNRLRLSRWMIGGMATAARPKSSAALSRVIGMNERPLALPLAEVDTKRPVHRLIGPQQVVIDADRADTVAQGLAEIVKPIEILAPQASRIHDQLMWREFEVVKLRE